MNESSQKDNPAVSRLQIERYRQMSNEERLEIGLRMWEFAQEFITASIQNEFRGIKSSGLKHHLMRRMQS